MKSNLVHYIVYALSAMAHGNWFQRQRSNNVQLDSTREFLSKKRRGKK
jgi:hypothetical protein